MSRKEKKYHFIYKTTDTRNGNFYIGMHSTNDLNDGYVGSGTRLRRLVYKYGKEIFSIEILEFLPNRKCLKKRESEIVNSELLKEDKCMNLKPGGDGGFNNKEHQFKCSQAAGLKHSERMKNDDEYRKNYSKKISEANKRRIERGDFKPINYSWLGKKHKPETIEKMKSLDRSGDKNSQYGTCWITKNSVNKKINKNEIEFFLNENWSLGRYTNLKGELVSGSKLKENDVRLIKEMINENKLFYSEISKIYNVGYKTIYRIKKGIIWKHIN